MAMPEHLFFLFAIFAAVVVGQPGFISIDCGIPEGSNYTDSETGIFYTSDAGFVQSGENREFPSSNLVASSLKRQYRSMRSFPDGERNCYTVRPVQKGSKYFVRASFMYVDYDKQKAPEFDLYVGINLWTRISLANASLPFWTEIVLVATIDFIPVCLVNTGSGDPFISAVEARLLKDSMYKAATYNQSLLAEWLYDAGSTSEQIIRYPDDDYDRFWLPYTDPSWASISTSLTVENSGTDYYPPLAVMRTAATPMNSNGSLYFNWTANDTNTEFHMFIHFADFQKSNGSTTLREFYYCINKDSCLAYKLEYLVAFTVYTASPWSGFRDYSIAFSKTEKSVLPPILNAFEIYIVLTLNETATDEKDVDAIMNIKGIYGLEKNWMGDPCLPNKYLWDGLTCSYDNDNPPRIISLNLSSSGLSGKIDASIGNLKLIQSLYPDDDYDRFWLPYTDPSWASISTSLTVENLYLGFEPPSAVMKTAATPMNVNGSLYFNWTANDPKTEFHIFRHFADFQKSNGSTTLREFYCCNNGDSCFAQKSTYLVASTVYTTRPMTGVRDYSISFSKTEKSVLPPILNAFEIYIVLTLNETATDKNDVYAIMSIKDIYGLEKNWMGDPCLPNKYLWDGLTCSYDNDNPPRIISLNLSSSGLSGKIDASIGNLKLIQSLDLSKNNIEGPIPPFLATLTSLAHLDLSQNNLTGTVPQFLAALIYLSYLNLSHNQLSGSVPISLVDESRSGSLTLSVDPNLCNSPSCNATDPCALKSCKKSPSVVVPVVVAVAITTVAIGIAVLIWFKCRRPRAARPNPQNIKREDFLDLESRRFSYDEIVTVTNNFQRVIGKGAFGTVYHGQMKDGTEVAIKMLSQHAQASVEFQTEAQLLMTLHHRHLVRFIGYCADGDKKALILEYMAKGNLGKVLAAQDEMETLSWDQRLRIGLDVSQGLEYLHVGCKPPIIHRDVKAANILLNENLEAKLADFGICKVFTDEYYTHMSTQVKGTHGYLDPEYFSSHNLNEKSDVYSFGVVLLELITGRPAIIETWDSQKIGLVEWVSSLISGGDVRNIMDPKLQADYDITSAWKALDISISCTQPKSVQRPSISGVVAELKDCLKVVNCRDRSSGNVTDEFVARSSSNSIYCPLPR